MTILNSRKSSSAKPKWGAMVLVVCFGMIALFGSPIHDHDLDSSHLDLDCISCHLVHSNIGLENDETNLFVDTQEIQSASIVTTPILIVGTSSVSSRAPPVICWSVFLFNIQTLAGPWDGWVFCSFSKRVYIPSSALKNYAMRKREFCLTRIFLIR